MSKQRMYHSSFNHNGFKKKQGAKSRAHNLRAEITLKNLYTNSVEMEQICDPDLIKNNLIYIDFKKANPLDGEKYFKEITARLDAEKKEYIAKLEKGFTDSNKAELSDGRAKAKAAFKRYAGSSEGAEQAYWLDIAERLGNEPLDPLAEAQKLQAAADGKIKRYNQKAERLSTIDQYNELIGIKSRNTQFTIFSKELLYKFPDNTNLKVDPMHLAQFTHSMNTKLFPDFRCTYIAIHSDENPDNPHAHTELSGLNLKTGEMDIQQQLFINLEKQYLLKNQPFPFTGRDYNDLNYSEVQRFGEVYQDFIYDEINSFLVVKGYSAKLEKRTAEEKEEDSREFKEKYMPTQKREHTRAKKMQNENKKLDEKININSELVGVLDNEIKSKKEELTNIKKLTKAAKDIYLNVKETLKSALDFSKTSSEDELLNYKNSFKQIKDAEIAKKIEAESIDIQPTDDQKEKIKVASRRRNRRGL